MKVIKIGAVWCNGCLVMRPRWKEIEQENPWLETEYYDYDNDRQVIDKFGLDGDKLPTFIFLDKQDQEIDRKHGEITKESLISLINQYKER